MPVALLLALALGTSGSKLGPHVLGSVSDSGATTILAACPKVAKWLTPDGAVAASIRDYRQRCPCGEVVLRVYVDGSTHYSTSQDAASAAADFWSKMQGGLSGLSAADVDWLEGPNELDNLEDWYHDAGKAQWFASFWSSLADRMNSAGWHPLVGSVAVGNPALDGELGAGSANAFKVVADAMKAKSYRWGWSYHGYTQNMSTDVATELWLSLRYRTIRDQCGLQGVPIVLTEGGRDNGGGWQGYASGAAFLAWLEWFDARMGEDSEVAGVTLFQVGEHGQWNSFDLGPIASDLAAYLTSVPGAAGCSSPDAGTPPHPLDAGSVPAPGTMEFAPAQPLAAKPFDIIVRSTYGYTYVELKGTDPNGQATSQKGPAIAPGFSWTYSLTSASIPGHYQFTFSAAEAPAGLVTGSVTVLAQPPDASIPAGQDASLAGHDAAVPAGHDAAHVGSDASSPAIHDGSQGTADAAQANSDAGTAAKADGSVNNEASGECGCATGSQAFAWLALAALTLLRRSRPTG
jgi:MYXO-CTERM domain-containing protein